MKEITLTMMRAQPPSIGHKKIIDRVLEEETDHVICLSASGPEVIGCDIRKNPLSFSCRESILRKVYPQVVIKKESSMWSMLMDFGSRYDKINLVCGSDRYREYQKFLRYELDFSCLINIIQVPRIDIRESGTFLRICLKDVDISSFDKYSLILYDEFKEITENV